MKLLTAATVLSVVFSAAAYADDGTWNAGASNLLIGNSANPGSGNAGMSQHLPNGTGGSATSQGQNSSVVCDGGRCFTPRRGR
jgi:hypothetical protein